MGKLAGREPRRFLETFFRHFKCDHCSEDIVVRQKDVDKKLDAHFFNNPDHPNHDFTEHHAVFCPCCGHHMHDTDHCPKCFCEIFERHCSIEELENSDYECVYCEA